MLYRNMIRYEHGSRVAVAYAERLGGTMNVCILGSIVPQFICICGGCTRSFCADIASYDFE